MSYNFTQEQLERYKRNINLKEIGLIGQEKILNAKVLIIGAGGLGSSASLYLAALGIGTLGIVDKDKVELSNLQRQIIHNTLDLDKPKVISAKEKITNLNPDINVITYDQKITKDNIMDILINYNFIIDATDNFETKFLINDACVSLKKPFSHGGVLGFEGQTFTYTPGNTCYRCIFKEPPPKKIMKDSSKNGILGSTPGLLGIIQATEALKYITNCGELLINKLLVFDLRNMDFRTVKLKKDNKCKLCV